jgi:hypothetical protein
MGGYSPDEPKPLVGYALLSAAWNAAAVGYGAALRRSSRRLPQRVPAGDYALMTVATHKLSRLIAKDRVTSFLRAPFTRFQEEAGPSEVTEEPRGSGLQLAIGELLVCPYCVGLWVAGAFVGAYVARPDATRMVAATFAVLGGSDFLQQAWTALDKRA